MLIPILVYWYIGINLYLQIKVDCWTMCPKRLLWRQNPCAKALSIYLHLLFLFPKDPGKGPGYLLNDLYHLGCRRWTGIMSRPSIHLCSKRSNFYDGHTRTNKSQNNTDKVSPVPPMASMASSRGVSTVAWICFSSTT